MLGVAPTRGGKVGIQSMFGPGSRVRVQAWVEVKSLAQGDALASAIQELAIQHDGYVQVKTSVGYATDATMDQDFWHPEEEI